MGDFSPKWGKRQQIRHDFIIAILGLKMLLINDLKIINIRKSHNTNS